VTWQVYADRGWTYEVLASQSVASSYAAVDVARSSYTGLLGDPLVPAGEKAWCRVVAPTVNVGGVNQRVTAGWVFSGGQWRQFFPDVAASRMSLTTSVVHMVLGAPVTIAGEVAVDGGQVEGGTVVVQLRRPGDEWMEVAHVDVAAGPSPAAWSTTVTSPIGGMVEYRALYSGSAHATPSESPVTVTDGVVDAPGGLKGGAVTDTTLAFSWAAGGDAVWWKVYRNGVYVGTALTPSFVDAGLEPGTAYSYTVVAEAPWGESAKSVPIVGTTSQKAEQRTGATYVDIPAQAAGMYRSDVGWVSGLGQSYYMDPALEMTGWIDYGDHSRVTGLIAAALGADVAANATVGRAYVRLDRVAGFGDVDGGVTVTFIPSPSALDASVGLILPTDMSGAVDAGAPPGGLSDWADIGPLGAALVTGSARSLVIHNSDQRNWLEMRGPSVSSDACLLRLLMEWDYAVSANAGGWR
jgi:hypothetical protein